MDGAAPSKEASPLPTGNFLGLPRCSSADFARDFFLGLLNFDSFGAAPGASPAAGDSPKASPEQLPPPMIGTIPLC
jgi:hypothetical protein